MVEALLKGDQDERSGLDKTASGGEGVHLDRGPYSLLVEKRGVGGMKKLTK